MAIPTANPLPSQQRNAPLPSHWREALLTLIASRVAIFQLESKAAAKNAARRVAALIALVLCLFFAWALVLAGTIAAIAELSSCPWHWLALAAAALHLAAAALLARLAKSPTSPEFSVTRAEFLKDRQWIENFQKTPKSND